MISQSIEFFIGGFDGKFFRVEAREVELTELDQVDNQQAKGEFFVLADFQLIEQDAKRFPLSIFGDVTSANLGNGLPSKAVSRGRSQAASFKLIGNLLREGDENAIVQRLRLLESIKDRLLFVGGCERANLSLASLPGPFHRGCFSRTSPGHDHQIVHCDFPLKNRISYLEKTVNMRLLNSVRAAA